MVRAIPALSPPFANIRSALDLAIPSTENGKPMLPLLAAFAIHNAKRQVAASSESASIQPLRASSPYKNVKSGKNGNVDHPSQQFPHISIFSSSFLCDLCGSISLLLHEPHSPPFLRVGSRHSSPSPRPLRPLRFDLLPPGHRRVDPMLPAYVHCHPAAWHNAPLPDMAVANEDRMTDESAPRPSHRRTPVPVALALDPGASTATATVSSRNTSVAQPSSAPAASSPVITPSATPSAPRARAARRVTNAPVASPSADSPAQRSPAPARHAPSRTRPLASNIAGLGERARIQYEPRLPAALPDPLAVLLPGLRQALLDRPF